MSIILVQEFNKIWCRCFEKKLIMQKYLRAVKISSIPQNGLLLGRDLNSNNVLLDDDVNYKPCIYCVDRKVVYLQLLTPKIFCILDYIGTVVALCDTLSVFYSKFQDISVIKPHVWDCLLKADNQFKANILEALVGNLTNVSLKAALARDFKQVSSLFMEKETEVSASLKAVMSAFDINEDNDFETRE